MLFFVSLVSSSYAARNIDKNLLKKFLPEDSVIVEAGAYYGQDTVELSKLFSKGTIYAFEPVPKVFVKLKETTQGFRNIICFPLALGDKNGQVDIFVSGGHYDGFPGSLADASSSLLKPKEHLNLCKTITFEEKVSVSVVTLDEWIISQNISKIDFLWLDLQGYEYNVLKASPNVLKSLRAIYTEVSLAELYEGLVQYGDLKKFLEQEGFEVAWESQLESYMQKNVLFVRSKLSSQVPDHVKAVDNNGTMSIQKTIFWIVSCLVCALIIGILSLGKNLRKPN